MLRLKAIQGKDFKARFSSLEKLIDLYQLDITLIGTQNHNGISRVSVPFRPRGLIGIKSDHCLSYVLVPFLLEPY